MDLDRAAPDRTRAHVHAHTHTHTHTLRRIAGRDSLATTQRYLHPGIHKITAADAARSPPSPIVMTR
ncbi:hypothetical protein OHA98_14735 [Streptomyces sp. NBC_00654]|uniref:hypothetical protein n=1 Tax=Streptomyces sp. NBC_00654 TaxID=2975799 RepID=UPI00225579D7|nr:hypothetical protein [Streptomyces sp. NBC_00654]MCX4966078.1 hypothetical protein [Streptomyces sp. NBC_00654]